RYAVHRDDVAGPRIRRPVDADDFAVGGRPDLAVRCRRQVDTGLRVRAVVEQAKMALPRESYEETLRAHDPQRSGAIDQHAVRRTELGFAGDRFPPLAFETRESQAGDRPHGAVPIQGELFDRAVGQTVLHAIVSDVTGFEQRDAARTKADPQAAV